MANWDLLHRFHDNVDETASGAQVTEDFDQGREKIEALENAGSLNGAGVRGLFVDWVSQGFVGGPTNLFEKLDEGVNFATACDHAWISGWETFSDAAFTTPQVIDSFNPRVEASGKHINVKFQASVSPFYFRLYVVAMGH